MYVYMLVHFLSEWMQNYFLDWSKAEAMSSSANTKVFYCSFFIFKHLN